MESRIEVPLCGAHMVGFSVSHEDCLEVLKDFLRNIWGFPKIRDTFLGVPILRIIVFWGLYWGPLILGNYHLSAELPDTVNWRWTARSPGIT